MVANEQRKAGEKEVTRSVHPQTVQMVAFHTIQQWRTSIC